MPSIHSAQLRALARRLADNDGKIDAKEVDQLVDAVMQDGTLAPEEKAELSRILADFSDRIESPEAKKRLRAFLDIRDEGVRNLAHRLERDDGVIDASDAERLKGLVSADGRITADERYSVGAVLIGAKLTAEAKEKLAGIALRPEVTGFCTPNLSIPDNDPRGATDTLTLDESGLIDAIAVDVDISHTWRGDLTVKLTAPDGTEVLLHDRTGRGADDIRGSYPGTLQPAQPLDALKGKPVRGDWKLTVIDSAGRDVGTIQSWGLRIRTKAPETGEARPLDPTGTSRPVYLSPAGFFVEDPTLDAPRTHAELGSGLFRMAELVDDKKENPFTAVQVSLAERKKVLDNLKAALALVPPSGAHPDDISAKQALQLRSSAVTVLLALIEATGNRGEELELKREAFQAYSSALLGETNPVLRDSMIWNLKRASASLPSDLRRVADGFVEEIAPTKPPYEEWFKDGNKTLNVSWTCGADEEFYAGTVEMLQARGFSPEGDVPSRGPAVFKKTLRAADGTETEVRIKVGVNRNSIFDDMDEENVHIVGYDGHSDIGRSVPRSLRNGPDEKGKKLIFTGLCAGKDTLHLIRERYPDSQVLTTFTSSYFNTKTVNGKTVMSRSENFNVLMELVEAAAKREDWETINKRIRDNAILYPWLHVMPGSSNYISPIHTEIRRKVLDTDHDGQADYLDKLVNFDTFKVPTDTAREFQAIPPSRPANVLDGTVTHLAAMALNTATGYNSVTKPYKKGNISGDGYFEPKPGDPIVKFERDRVEGEDILRMKVNAHYAHMSVEALRAVAQYEFIQFIADDVRLTDPVDKKLMGLVFAAFSILYDEARWGRDDEIWRGLLDAMGLPSNIPFAPIRRLLDEEHHDYSGNMQHVREWKQHIPEDALDALRG